MIRHRDPRSKYAPATVKTAVAAVSYNRKKEGVHVCGEGVELEDHHACNIKRASLECPILLKSANDGDVAYSAKFAAERLAEQCSHRGVIPREGEQHRDFIILAFNVCPCEHRTSRIPNCHSQQFCGHVPDRSHTEP